MKVDIWSDVVCPFCYIGKRRYEQALAQFAHRDEVETEWHSFLLRAGTEPTIAGENIYQYLSRVKDIPYEQSVAMHQRVTAMAADAGLQYNFDKVVVANSHHAHHLIQLAKTHGLGDVIEERLFKAYFTEGRDIANATVLADIAQETGLPQDALSHLADKEYVTAMQADITAAEQIGINGVPFFIFANRYALSGAQPTDIFLQALTKAYEEWNKSVHT